MSELAEYLRVCRKWMRESRKPLPLRGYIALKIIEERWNLLLLALVFVFVLARYLTADDPELSKWTLEAAKSCFWLFLGRIKVTQHPRQKTNIAEAE